MRDLRRAWGYFRDDAGSLVVALVLVVLLAGLGVLAPVPLAILFNLFDPKGGGGDGWVYGLFGFVPRRRDGATVLTLAGLTLGLRLAVEVVRAAQARLQLAAGYRGRARAQRDLFAKLTRLPPAWHRARPAGATLHALTRDTAGFHAGLNLAAAVVVNLVTLLVMLAVMLGLNARLTLVALAVVPLLAGTMLLWRRRLRTLNAGQCDADALVLTRGQRAMAALPLIQGFGREPHERDRFGGAVAGFVRTSLRLHRGEIWYGLALGGVLAAAFAALLGYGGLLVLRGSLSIGSLWLFVSYLGGLYDPLSKLANGAAEYAAAATGAGRALAVLDEPEEIADAADAADAADVPGGPLGVRFEGVDFAYRGGPAVLRDVCLTIAPGEFVAIVGPSGAGKSTLLHLVPRLADVAVGRVTVGEIDVRRLRLADLRRRVALVSQDAPVLAASAWENLTYGRPDASEAEARRAAEQAGAAAFLESLPLGYETQLGEGGADLSGGERQRLAVARAILSDAPVLLLDEPTAALDAAAESHLMDALRGLAGRRTILLATHRPAAAARADRIVTLDGGRVANPFAHNP